MLLSLLKDLNEVGTIIGTSNDAMKVWLKNNNYFLYLSSFTGPLLWTIFNPVWTTSLIIVKFYLFFGLLIYELVIKKQQNITCDYYLENRFGLQISRCWPP